MADLTTGNQSPWPIRLAVLIDSEGNEIGSSNPLPVSGEGPIEFFPLTLSLAVATYADGDVLADTQEIAGVFLEAGGKGTLDALIVRDEDDQGVAMDLIFLRTNASLGTEESAPDISGADARNIIARIRVAADDYIDLGGSRLANLFDIKAPLEADSASTSLFVGAITRGAPTHTASGIRIEVGIRY